MKNKENKSNIAIQIGAIVSPIVGIASIFQGGVDNFHIFLFFLVISFFLTKALPLSLVKILASVGLASMFGVIIFLFLIFLYVFIGTGLESLREML